MTKMDLTLPEPDGFIEVYMDYAGELSEAPDIFNQFMALALLSSVAGNKIYMPWGGAKLFPNVWFILVAASSSFKKSQSFVPTMKLLHRTAPERILPNAFSMEKLLTTLSKNPAGSFFFGEFKSLMEAMQRSYADCIGLVTELFDPRVIPFRRELNNTSFTIEDQAINI